MRPEDCAATNAQGVLCCVEMMTLKGSVNSGAKPRLLLTAWQGLNLLAGVVTCIA
ncbi:MAG: hypothetical protein PSV18_03325 [Methylobacter sp.]|nr:hypothetical protein [Candidatus Methylobacter titanis]